MLLIRGLGVVFLLACWSLASQLQGLLGPGGLTPAAETLASLKQELGAWAWIKAPTVFWLDGASLAGLWLVTLLGASAGVAMVVGWLPWWSTVTALVCYGSLMRVGGPWLQFSWDELLIEVAVVSLLLSSPRWRRIPSIETLVPNPLGVFMMNLLLAKVMFGSGISKLMSGDALWQDATALMAYFETQPLPSVLGWWAHVLPADLLRRMVWVTMFIEIVLPFYMFFPRSLRVFAACCFGAEMILIHLTGTYGFLNLLLLILALMWIDDRSWSRLIPKRFRQPRPPVIAAPALKPFRLGVASGLLILWVPLMISSAFPQNRLPVPRPWAKVAALARSQSLCNHYAFSSVVPRLRLGFEVQGSLDGKEWKPYGFRYHPWNPFLPPRYAGFHMPRLDRNAWERAMIALTPAGQPPPPWVRAWMQGLLEGRPEILGLMGANPFSEQPPVVVRIVLNGQSFADPVSRRRTGLWWNRQFAGVYAQAVRTP